MMQENILIDLRSDTVTRPTPKMREAMATTPVGDDVYGDDPAVNELEALAAQVTGKEAALFVCSGTMGNQVAIMSHTRMGEEIITALSSHIIQHEGGAHARLSGVSAMIVDTGEGALSPAQIQAAVRTPDIHHPNTSLLCLENTLSNGTVVPLATQQAQAEVARDCGLFIHLDGARLFNAATALGVSAAALCADVDSVMFCLSKGLGAPVGSMLCGSADFIARARKHRKILGGGLRQAGVLAACGLIAIREQSKRLYSDHQNAKAFARALAQLPGVDIDFSSVQTNMVWARIHKEGLDDAAFVAAMKEAGLLMNGPMGGRYRFITHMDVNARQLERAVGLIAGYLSR